MEPQIIDYYNDYPSSINIIDKLNEEYENLRYIYEIKNKKLNRYKIPYTISETLQEYKVNHGKITACFSYTIKHILNDDDIGVVSICDSVDSISNITIDKLYKGLYINQYIKHSLIDKIINTLNIITEDKNKKWCKTRIHTVFNSLRIKNKIYSDYDEMINDIVDNLLGNFLPDTYNELCHKITFTPDKKGIYYPNTTDCNLCDLLNYMKCSKCNNLHNDNIYDNLCHICE